MNQETRDLRKAFYIVLKPLSNHINGINKAMEDTDLLELYILDKTKGHQEPLHKEDKNTFYNSAMKPMYFDSQGWVEIQQALDLYGSLIADKACSKKPQELLNLPADIRIAIAQIFRNRMSFQTLLISMLSVYKFNDPGKILADIFNKTYSIELLQTNKEKYRIEYIKLAKNLGLDIFRLCFQQLLKNNGYFKGDQISLERLKNYVMELSIHGYYKPMKINEINRIDPYSEETNNLVLLFANTFDFKEHQKIFDRKALIVFIRQINLLLIEEFFAKAKRSLIKPKNYKQELLDTSSDAHDTSFYEDFLPILEKIETYDPLKNAKSQEDPKFRLLGIHQQFQEEVQFCYIRIGNEILDVLKKEEILVVESLQEGLKKTPSFVTLKKNCYEVNLTGTLPAVDLTPLTGFDRLALGSRITYQSQITSDVSDNHYIKGNMEDKEVFDENMKNNKFTLNFPFLIKFFTAFKNLKDENFSTPFIYNDRLMFFLKFLSNLFDIDFNNFYLSVTAEMKSLIENMILYTFDFNNLGKFDLTPYDKDVYKPYYHIIKAQLDQIYSKKIMLNTIFNQLSIIAKFEYFYYRWFSDGRGRKLQVSNLSLQGLPIIRSFISFYQRPTILKVAQDYLNRNNIKDKLERNKEITKQVMELGKHMEQQLYKIIPENIKIDEKTTFEQLCCSLPIGKAFAFIPLFDDYLELVKYQEQATFWYPQGLDSNNSGLQMLALILKSHDLASCCSLVENSTDTYLNAAEHLKASLNKIKNFIESLDKALIENLKKLKLDPEFQQSVENVIIPEDLLIITSKATLSVDEKFKLIKRFLSLYNNLTDKLVKIIINRKTCKILCMTAPYGSTAFGSIEQMLDKTLKHCLLEGLWLTNTEFGKLKIDLALIYEIFHRWYEKEMFLALVLVKAFKKYCNAKAKWDIFQISSKLFSYSVKPMVSVIYRYTLPGYSKKSGIRRVYLRTNKAGTIDYAKLVASFPANIAQFADALVVSYYNQYLKEWNTKANVKCTFFTNHDCFYISAPHFLLNREAIIWAYEQVYKEDIFERNFNKETNKEFNDYVISILKKYKKLHLDQICKNPDFIK